VNRAPPTRTDKLGWLVWNKLPLSSVLITGATGGIGSALAEAYAAPGIELVLHGRDQALLAELASRCRALGAGVRCGIVDLRDRVALKCWLNEVGAQLPLDLVIVNAGVNINIGADGAGERWEAIEALLEVNVMAALATIDAVLPAMRARRRGQIALVSSLAAWYGLPITPSYCASKAALKAYGEAIRGWLAPEGVRINVVMPGFVESRMCREFPGPKPFLWTAERAAAFIKHGLERDRPRISFPFPLNLGSWLLAVLPPRASERLLALLDYRG
jgi:short-subunit dehydrogenase